MTDTKRGVIAGAIIDWLKAVKKARTERDWYDIAELCIIVFLATVLTACVVFMAWTIVWATIGASFLAKLITGGVAVGLSVAVVIVRFLTEPDP